MLADADAAKVTVSPVEEPRVPGAEAPLSYRVKTKLPPLGCAPLVNKMRFRSVQACVTGQTFRPIAAPGVETPVVM